MKNTVAVVKGLLILMSFSSIFTSYSLLTKSPLPLLSVPNFLIGVMTFANIFMVIVLTTQRYSSWTEMMVSNYVMGSIFAFTAAQALFMFLMDAKIFVMNSFITLVGVIAVFIYCKIKKSRSFSEVHSAVGKDGSSRHSDP